MVRKIGRVLRLLNPFRLIGWLLFRLGNWRRGFYKIDYITLLLPASIPVLAEKRSWLQQRILGKPPLSLTDLNRIFEQIGDDPRPKGLILHLRGAEMSLADLDMLRNSLARLRGRGKRIICFAQGYDNRTYYLASIADEIVLQPGGEVATLGLRARATFFKDALDFVGVKLDSVAISPYKGAFDSLTRRDISPEGQAQLNWLLDSQYDLLVQGIAAGRGMTPDAVRAMIDAAPYLDSQALTLGYLDAVETEEALHRRLDSKRILTWDSAAKKVYRKRRQPFDKYVALLDVSGLMIPGESGSPPVDIPIPVLGGARAGDLTIVRQVRNLMRNKDAAAVVLFINSGGGAVAAAEAMTAALEELAKDRPLVAYMHSVAASGGYYVATPARWIVAQPGTITGSIGVIGAKVVAGGLFDRLRVHSVEFTRGANAHFNSELSPYTETQRIRAFETIQHIYRQFIGRVAAARGLSETAVDAVGGGRVWTGVQARENGLVDELGDLYAALKKARELANLPEDSPLVLLTGKARPLPAQLAEPSNPAAALAYLQTGAQMVASGSPLVIAPFDWKI